MGMLVLGASALVHVVATDAHGPGIREAGLSEALRRVRDEGLARYLTEEARRHRCRRVGRWPFRG